MLPPLPTWLNSATVDYFNVACAIVFIVAGLSIRACTHNQTAFSTAHIISDLLKGSSFFPFILLSLCVLWPELIDLLKATNKMTLFASGIMASLYVLSDFLRDAQGRRNGNGD